MPPFLVVNDHGHFLLEQIFLIWVVDMDCEDLTLAELIVQFYLHKTELAWHH